jgi:hypothetical protein
MPDHDTSRLMGEIERLRRNCSERGRRRFPLGVRWSTTGTEIDYLYRNHQLLCDSDDLDVVLRAFDQIGQQRPAVTDGPIGLSVLDLGDRDAADLADALADALGDDDIVTPNHVLDPQGWSALCPATEPVPWRGQVVDMGEPVGSRQARVAVLDSGYLASIAQDSGYARFSAVDPNSEPDDEVYAGTNIRPYGGHGHSLDRALAVRRRRKFDLSPRA